MSFPSNVEITHKPDFCTLSYSASIIYHKTLPIARVKCEKHGKNGKNHKKINAF